MTAIDGKCTGEDGGHPVGYDLPHAVAHRGVGDGERPGGVEHDAQHLPAGRADPDRGDASAECGPDGFLESHAGERSARCVDDVAAPAERVVDGVTGWHFRSGDVGSLRAALRRVEDDGVIWIDELFGAQLYDQTGVLRGRVVEVEANPASDIMVLDSGALVPLTFVTRVEANVRVDVEVPEGLFE